MMTYIVFVSHLGCFPLVFFLLLRKCLVVSLSKLDLRDLDLENDFV